MRPEREWPVPEPPCWWSRFLDKAVRIPADADQEVGCLIWVGAQSRGGGRTGGFYGSFRVSQRFTCRAHICAAYVGRLIRDFKSPPGMHVDHECRRTLCVEPRHLRLLTGRDNVLNGNSMGERPLTEEQVEVIRLRGICHARD